MDYIIPKGQTSSGNNVSWFIPKVIQGNFKLHSDCIYDTSKMTDREKTSFCKITGMANLLSFNSNSCRIGFRMDLSGLPRFEIVSYCHDQGEYNPQTNPGKHICYVNPGDLCYYRIEESNYNYKVTVNSTTINHSKSTKVSLFRARMFPFIQMGDLPAPHQMTITVI